MKKTNAAGDWDFFYDTDEVVPVNSVEHSLFQSVQLSLANCRISYASNYYPYRAYMESLLRHSEGAQIAYS